MSLSRRSVIQSLSRLAVTSGLGPTSVGTVGLSTAGLLVPSQSWAQDFTMKLTTTTSNALDSEWLALLKQGVETSSGGKITANLYPASQLGSAQTTIEGVVMGTVEVTVNASGSYEGLEPRFASLAVPGVIHSMAQGAKVMSDSNVRRCLGSIGRDKGVEVITALTHSPTGIVSRRPIHTLADFKGMKIRVPGSALVIEHLTKLGASPVAMSLGEVLPAFQNGTIDGVYAGSTIFTAFKYYDIAKNMTLLPGTFLVIVGLVNSAFMQSLGSLEHVVRDAAAKADVAGAIWGEADVGNALSIWEKNGGQTTTLPSDDAENYLQVAVRTAMDKLTPAARADYEIIKDASARYI